MIGARVRWEHVALRALVASGVDLADDLTAWTVEGITDREIRARIAHAARTDPPALGTVQGWRATYRTRAGADAALGLRGTTLAEALRATTDDADLAQALTTTGAPATTTDVAWWRADEDLRSLGRRQR